MYMNSITKNRIVIGALLLVLLVGVLPSASPVAAGAGDCFGWGVKFIAGPSGAEASIGVTDTGTGQTLAFRHFFLGPSETRSVTFYVIVPSGSVSAFATISGGSLESLVNGWVGAKHCATATQPGPDMVMIPAQAVVGTFTTNTPLYFAPEAGAETSSVMDAGQSLWVYGLDASGAFYEVLLSGGLYWVPVGTIGPTSSAPWNGAPLPTTVVDSVTFTG
jgi:hypothetical protein